MADSLALPEAAAETRTGESRRKRRLFVAAAVLFFSLASGLVWGGGLLRYLGIGSAEASSTLTFELSPAVEQDLLASTRGEMATRHFEGEQALKINASLPFTTAPLEAASPFSLAQAAASDKDTALLCLTQAVYYEAGFEPVEGRRAVAQVILNRMRHPAFPKTVCGVVYEGSSRPGCQFSFTCDGSLRRPPAAAAWNTARRIAEEALAGYVATEVGAATHYHANYVSPYWAPKLAKLTQIGAHIFYRWPGGWGRKGAFTGRYAGSERIPGDLADPTAAEALVDAAQDGILPQAPDERRTANDIGGRLDVSKGWVLNIPGPNESSGAMARALATQGQAAVAQAAPAAVAMNDGGAGKEALQ